MASTSAKVNAVHARVEIVRNRFFGAMLPTIPDSTGAEKGFVGRIVSNSLQAQARLSLFVYLHRPILLRAKRYKAKGICLLVNRLQRDRPV